jgi:hypothetical protein
MMRRVRSDRPTSITTAPESPSQELARRQRRYAVMAAIFIACFTSAALLHRDTAVALVLCGVAMATLVLAVIGANVRSPRQGRADSSQVVDEHRQLRSRPADRPPRP